MKRLYSVILLASILFISTSTYSVEPNKVHTATIYDKTDLPNQHSFIVGDGA